MLLSLSSLAHQLWTDKVHTNPDYACMASE